MYNNYAANSNINHDTEIVYVHADKGNALHAFLYLY